MKTQKSMQEMWKDSYLFGDNDTYLEELYETYLKTPDNVTPEWRDYFNALSKASTDVSHADVKNYFLQLAKSSFTTPTQERQHEPKQEKVIELISAYRRLGHLQAHIDPLGLYHGIADPTLDLAYYGFTEADLNTVFDVGSFTGLKKNSATLL